MTLGHAVVAACAYFALVATLILHLRSKCIPQDCGDQAPDENGTAGAGGANFINHGERDI